jgi:uncharacterized protein (DUF3084 family)
MQIKLDVKSIIILLLAVFSILFFSLWFLKGTGYKKEYKKLEQEFDRLQKSRDSLKTINIKLKKDFDIIEIEVKKRDSLIKIVEKELVKTKQELKEAKKEVAKWQFDFNKTKKKIEDLKKNPIKREDEDLIQSLSEKLK